MNTKQMPVRLAMRHEGDWWNAYMARADTMTDAILIGTIRIGAVANNPERKQAFMDLMKDVLADAAEVLTGTRPEHFDEGPAPESERAGHS